METQTAHTKRRRLSHESILLPQSYNLVLVPEITADHPSSSSSSSSSSSAVVAAVTTTTSSGNNRICCPSTSTNRQRENINNPTDLAMYLWQQNQMLKCVEDNSINHVLESYLQFFEEDTRITDTIPVSHFNVSNTGLEESAILMAISEHGLQNPEIMVVEPDLNQSENEVCDFTNVERTTATASSSSNHQIVAVDQQQEQQQQRRLSVDDEPLINEEMFNEHFDFMEQAIQSAIQKKGLTPFVTSQMSPTR